MDEVDKSTTSELSNDQNHNDIPDYVTFDQVLTERIKLGKAQWLAFLTVGIVWIAEGSELILNPLLSLALKQGDSWGITNSQSNWLTTSLFLGFFLGAFPSGYFGDKFGRRKSLLVILFLMFLFGVISAFSWNVYVLMVFRFAFGLFIGLAIPISITLQTEITPKEMRGKLIVWTVAFFVVGEIIVVGFAFYFFKTLQNAQWRELIICLQIFKLFGFLWSIKYFPESPRYLFWISKYDEAVKAANNLMAINRGKRKKIIIENNENNENDNLELELVENSDDPDELTTLEIEQLIEWTNLQRVAIEGQRKQALSWKQFMDPHYFKMTAKLSILWISLTLSYFGTVYAETYILNNKYEKENSLSQEEKKNKQFTELFISTAIEFPSYVISGFLIEKTWMGRKRMMILGFGIAFIISTIVFSYQGMSEIFFTILIAIDRFAFSISFVTIQPYTTEVYPTSIRNKGLGLNSSCSRFAGILLVWILDGLYEINFTGPFLLFSILCLSCVLCLAFLPDTLGLELDSLKLQKQSILPSAKSLTQSLKSSVYTN